MEGLLSIELRLPGLPLGLGSPIRINRPPVTHAQPDRQRIVEKRRAHPSRQ